jgi:hypothetical protein
VVGSELLTSSRISLPSQRVQALPSRPRPWFDELQRTEICNAVTDCDAKGNNRTDDTAKLQACVRRCTAVFLPSGVYMISDTLLLRHNSVLVGEALSQIFLGSGSAGFGDPTVPKPVVDTPDDVGGSVRVTEITIQTGGGNRGAVLLRWRVGPASGLWDVHLNISSNVSDKRSVQRFDLTLSVLHACSGKRVCDSLICWTLR